MALSVKKIETIMLFHLENLNTSGEAVDKDTVLGVALSKAAVAGMSARALFKVLTRRDIIVNGGTDKPWPADWPALTIRTLAPQLAD